VKKPITFLTSIATVSISLMLAPAYAHHAGWAHHSGGGGGGSGFHASGGGHGGFDPWQLHGHSLAIGPFTRLREDVLAMPPPRGCMPLL